MRRERAIKPRRQPRAARSRLILIAMVAVVVAVIVPVSSTTAGATTSTACNVRVNNSPRKLVDCVTQADLWAHMVKFQAIADANPGADGHPSRNSGEPGYKASADYVADTMRAAGYDVTLQEYKFHYFSFVGTPVLREDAPQPQSWTVGSDFAPGQARGTVTATLQPAGGIVLPPSPTPTSASGCTAADFAGFVAGKIALIQRGTCAPEEKVANAQSAGASGVVIFNEGNPDRTGLVTGQVGTPTIPVVFATYAVGAHLFDEHAATGGTGPRLTIDVKGIDDPNRSDWNVIADSKGGDPNNILVVDAHLDAIYGAGMLDNASGSAAILEIGQQLKNTNTRNKLRFIWFGGEELGLLGSQYYVNNLSASELSKIKYALDADVLATPNYLVGVVDPAGATLFGRNPGTPMPPQIYGPSKVGVNYGVDYLSSIGKNHLLLSADGTDAFSFMQAGVPASGLLTGQDCCKLPTDVQLFGGVEGNFEGTVPGTDGGCVDNAFRWCDNLSNNDPVVLTFMSKAFATMVANMAYYTTVFSAPHSGQGHGPVKAAVSARGKPSQ